MPEATSPSAVWRDLMVFGHGTTPQIVTETLWALVRQKIGIVPQALHVLTTLQGRAVCRRRLLDEGRLAALCDELGIVTPSLTFHMLRSASGKALDDVRDTAENTILANTILRVTRDLTAARDTRLSVSLSGGRKTMGFYMGYAMSLFGRPQDALYHVMVPPDWERTSGFFYIPSVPALMQTADGRTICTDDARIELAEIPFLRLRHSVNEPILEAKDIDFGTLLRAFQAALERPSLRLFDSECRISYAGHDFTLRPQLYALYRVFAEACAKSIAGAGPAGLGSGQTGWLTSRDFAVSDATGAQAYLRALQCTERVSDSTFMWTRDYLRNWGNGTKEGRVRMAKLFNPILARLREALGQAITEPNARLGIRLHTEGRNPTRYGLMLEPTQVVLAD